MKTSDIIVIPTKYVHNEPPLVILEAMNLGKAVITTNVCGLPEIVKDNGFLVEPNSKSFFVSPFTSCVVSFTFTFPYESSRVG